MNEKTAEALETSIRHWEENLELAKAGTLSNSDIKYDTCALCLVFATPTNGFCQRVIGMYVTSSCPVQLRTGYGSCYMTPWEDVSKILGGWTSGGSLVSAVEAELDFLRSLREPRGSQP